MPASFRTRISAGMPEDRRREKANQSKKSFTGQVLIDTLKRLDYAGCRTVSVALKFQP